MYLVPNTSTKPNLDDMALLVCKTILCEQKLTMPPNLQLLQLTATKNSSTSATYSVAVTPPDASTSPITSSTSTPSASTPAPTTKEPQSYEETAPSISTPNILAAASADVL